MSPPLKHTCLLLGLGELGGYLTLRQNILDHKENVPPTTTTKKKKKYLQMSGLGMFDFECKWPDEQMCQNGIMAILGLGFWARYSTSVN